MDSVSSPLASPCSSPLSSIPSSPLSKLSRSPSLPGEYPSPSSSHGSSIQVLPFQRQASPSPASSNVDHEGAPPAKRRKIQKSSGPKRTEYLDLRGLNNSSDESLHQAQEPKLKKLVESLRHKNKIVVIAGAGISTSAGIPDFRSSTGLFTTLRSQHNLKSSGKHLFDASVYKNDSATSSFHAMVKELAHLTQNAQPTAFHHMLATMAEEGRLMRLYTQNVDGIDVALKPLATTVPLNRKGPWPTTIQLHGGLGKIVCSLCKWLFPFDGALFEGPEPPPCPECAELDRLRLVEGRRSRGVGRLRPRMVLYNEHNPDEDAIGQVSCADLKSRPDAVIVVGTSLKVPGIRRLAKEMCSVTRDKRGGFTAWINQDPEPSGIDVKDCWDLVVTGDCDDVARHVNLPKWDERDCGEYTKVPDDVQMPKKGSLSVVVESAKATGIPTPIDSPKLQSLPQAPSVSVDVIGTSTSKYLKQSALSFAPPVPGKDSKPQKKKAVRKPLPTTKPDVSLSAAFSVSKATTAAKKTTTKPADNISKVSFPGLAVSKQQPAVVNGIPQTSPPNGHRLAVEVPITPVPFDRNEIISPKGSSPKGMQNLLC